MIEKKKLRTETVYTPKDWCNLIATCKTRDPYIVHEMKKEDFKDTFPTMNKWMVNRKKHITGQKVEWLKIKWIRFEKSNPFTMFFKSTLQEDFGFNQIDMARYRPTRHRPNPIRADIGELPQLYSTPRAINPKKYDDIMSLLDYVPPIHHMFFKNLVTDEEASLQHPDNAGFGPETDGDEDENTQEMLDE